ncbi:MAG: hypothetical protein HOV87_04520 [Catenulispora sp.]|nr:hypothetical protein [Catenulispora sp.]
MVATALLAVMMPTCHQESATHGGESHLLTVLVITGQSGLTSPDSLGSATSRVESERCHHLAPGPGPAVRVDLAVAEDLTTTGSRSGTGAGSVAVTIVSSTTRRLVGNTPLSRIAAPNDRHLRLRLATSTVVVVEEDELVEVLEVPVVVGLHHDEPLGMVGRCADDQVGVADVG